jgi:type IV fimbrial biogenesis protein FimT
MKEAARDCSGLMQGFSLVQLLITVAIVAILTGLGIPSYKYITTSNRIANEINGLLGDLQYARFAAIKEGQTVTVCSSSTGTSCAASTNWATGWIVFNDANGNGTVDSGEAVLRVQQTFNGADTLTGTISGITFNREGFPTTTTAAPLTSTVTMTLHAAVATTQSTRCIQVGINGQILTEKVGTGACS